MKKSLFLYFFFMLSLQIFFFPKKFLWGKIPNFRVGKNLCTPEIPEYNFSHPFTVVLLFLNFFFLHIALQYSQQQFLGIAVV